ncbi:ABC transporter ATP-binding protein [Amycolatopsis sp. cmx-4-61]|uniref:ABC transporter ATP-binding protein n=1 Tax=Amycolatopsis sp. cmx-4-61 TaxID=2790937 RepID=UPI00397E063D
MAGLRTPARPVVAGRTASVVTATGLRKVYPAKRGPVEAVAGIDLDVRAGEFFGLLGPNGAGKSTTIGMLTTLVRPTSGSVRIAGFDAAREPVQVRRRISLVSQTNSVDRELTVEENLRYRARYWGGTRAAARRRADELLEQFGLGDRRGAMFYQLSGGQLRRMMIARALVQRPEILFLDEPTAGIDPHSRVNVWDVLGELHASGQTIVLTTHNIEEAERFCRRAAIIDGGRVLVCDEVSALIASAGGVSLVTATYDGPVSELDFGALPVVRDGASVRVSTAETDGLIAELVALGAAAGRRLLDVTTARPSLESAFLSLTGRAYRA